MASTKFITMTGYVEYAKIFEQNMDDNLDFREDPGSVQRKLLP